MRMPNTLLLMKKFIVIFALLCSGLSSFSQTNLQVKGDTVKVSKAELIIENKTRDTLGFLANRGNGRTEFRKLELKNLGDSAIAIVGQDTLNYSAGGSGKSFQFKVGVSQGAPAGGDSIYTSTELIRRNLKVWRNGAFQYRDPTDGILVDSTLGKITFRPALVQGDRIYIEALSGVSLSFTLPPPGFTTNLTKLNAGAFDPGNNTFTLRWATNNQTLLTAPRVLGLGSSTLAGFGLTSPNRLGDKIGSWLSTNTTSPVWINLAVGGYSSANILPGGSAGTNIDSALKADPSFIFISLPSNDVDAGLTNNQILANFRLLDTMALNKGVPIFWETSQPRTGFNAAKQTQLKVLADSIRTIWPQRFVEGFSNLVNASAATDAVIRSEYDNGDGVHLNNAGVTVVANSLFTRWQNYFQAIQGVSGYIVEASADGNSWSVFDAVSDPAVVKKTYTKPGGGLQYFRVRVQYTNGTYSANSNVATVYPAQADNNNRILVDLGGDGSTTTQAAGVYLGQLTPSPDGSGKYWNNWYGAPGGAGFVDGSVTGNLVTTTNSATTLSLKIIGEPYGTYYNAFSRGINANGFTSGVEDYPPQATVDNMFIHNSINPNGVILRIKGLVPTKTYTIKLWGARVSDDTTPRIMETRLGDETWANAKTMDARYASSATRDYNRAIFYQGITGKDSVDIYLRVAAGSTFSSLSVIDITTGDAPGIPTVEVRDTVRTLPSASMQLPGVVAANGNTISGYAWTQLSGPSTTTITNGNTATCTISNLTNGVYTYRLTVNTSGGTITDDATVTVYPDNGGLKTLRTYFSNTAAPAIPGWMNVHGPVTNTRVIIADPVTNWVIDNAGNTSVYWNGLAGSNSQDTAGMVTGNNSGIVPDIALDGYWFNYSHKYSTTDNLLIKGLNPAKTYTLKLVASRSAAATPPRFAAWRINGGVELLQNAFTNTSNQTVVTGVTPNGSGTIGIAVYAPVDDVVNGQYSYINALIIQEEL